MNEQKTRGKINIKRHERPPGRGVEGRDRPQRHPATARNPTPPGQEPTQSGAIELPRGRPSSPRAPLERPSSPRGDRAPPRATAQICPLPLPHATRARPAGNKRRVSTNRAAKSTLPLRSPSEIDPRARYPAMKSNRPASKKSRECGHVTRCRCQCRDSTNASHIHNGDAAKQHG